MTDPRQSARQRLRVPATILLRSGESRPVMIEDLSATGFAAITDSELAEGTTFRIGLTPGHARDARVIWAEPDRAGCEFLAPIAPEQRETAPGKTHG